MKNILPEDYSSLTNLPNPVFPQNRSIIVGSKSIESQKISHFLKLIEICGQLQRALLYGDKNPQYDFIICNAYNFVARHPLTPIPQFIEFIKTLASVHWNIECVEVNLDKGRTFIIRSLALL